jgi:UDP-2,3-diacylglucosamine pyrophosphatase LpxH
MALTQSHVQQLPVAGENGKGNGTVLPQVVTPAIDGEVHVANETYNLIVLSDLHLGEGVNPHTRKFSHRESFFYDEEFRNFLEYLKERSYVLARPWKLIFNGDLFDFPRVVSSPQGRDMEDWAQALRDLGRPVDDLEKTISKEERRYGLNTSDFKSVWKLMVIHRGHRLFFEALADFVMDGHRLVVIRGNHDIEFYWELVQAMFVRLLAQSYADAAQGEVEFDHVLRTLIRRVEFCQRAYLIENRVYIEHGNEYDKLTRVEGDLINGTELKVPAGSFFNRYVMNHVESMLPFADNLRPPSHIIRFLLKKRTSHALEILLRRIPKAFLRSFREHGLRFWLLATFVPYIVGLVYFLFAFLLPTLVPAYRQAFVALLGGVGSFLVEHWWANLGINFAILYVPKLLKFYSVFAGVKFLHKEAQQLLTRRKELAAGSDQRSRVIIFGHTHNADIRTVGERCWYVNSGTWTPTFDPALRLLLDNKKFSFVQLIKNQAGEFDFELLRWNDIARRPDRMILIDK